MPQPTDPQAWLFEPAPERIVPAPIRAEHARLAARLPGDVRLGAMTWSYRGWVGHVYAKDASERDLARHGLAAYAQHPLLTLAEIDRTYYAPLPAAEFRDYAQQVPESFRFLVKAHELCTVERFPMHPRYGKSRGQVNAQVFDADYAQRAVIEPTIEGLGERLHALLFQFSPAATSDPRAFADALHGFLRKLPGGIRYAVELRNAELLTPEYGAALLDTGAIHCHNAWTAMPSVLDQARTLVAGVRRPLLIRWLLRPNERFEAASARYAPFDRIVSEDPTRREQVAALIAKAHAHGVPSYVFVDNKAEGCAPESIALLAQSLVTRFHGC